MRSGRAFLVVDAYLDGSDGAANYTRLLAGEPVSAVHAVREPLPEDPSGFAGIVVSGSAASVREDRPWLGPLDALLRRALDRGVPILGVCFGHQALARAAIGPAAVRRSPTSELGWDEIVRTGPDELLDALPQRFVCFLSHEDEVDPAAPGIVRLARSRRCATQAFRVPGRPAWGVQFHPEMAPPEAEAIVRRSIARHAHLGGDLAGVLAASRDGRALGRALLERFAAVARGSPPAHSGHADPKVQ